MVFRPDRHTACQQSMQYDNCLGLGCKDKQEQCHADSKGRSSQHDTKHYTMISTFHCFRLGQPKQKHEPATGQPLMGVLGFRILSGCMSVLQFCFTPLPECFIMIIWFVGFRV